MFSVDPFSAQRGLCALTRYNGSTDSTNYDNSQHRLGTHSVVCRLVHTLRGVSICAHNPWCVDLCNTIRGVSTCARTPWCVDLCTHSVVCRLVHTLRGVSTCAHNPWCVEMCTHSVLCLLVKCHAAPEHIFNDATVHIKTGVCVSVSVLTEQLTTDLCQCVSPH